MSDELDTFTALVVDMGMELKHVYRNLTDVQQRCTELALEVRMYKAKLKLVEDYVKACEDIREAPNDKISEAVTKALELSHNLRDTFKDTVRP